LESYQCLLNCNRNHLGFDRDTVAFTSDEGEGQTIDLDTVGVPAFKGEPHIGHRIEGCRVALRHQQPEIGLITSIHGDGAVFGKDGELLTLGRRRGRTSKRLTSATNGGDLGGGRQRVVHVIVAGIGRIIVGSAADEGEGEDGEKEDVFHVCYSMG